MKKLFCIILALSLCGCTQPEDETSSKSPIEQTEIRIVCEEGIEKIERLTTAFEKQNPNVKFSIITTDPKDDFSLAVKALLSGQQRPTIILTKAEYLTDLVDCFADLSNESWIKNALPNTLCEVSRGGQIVAMPAEMEGIGFVYDKSAFEKVNINPENINSVERLTATIDYLSEKLPELKDFDAVFAKPDEETERYLLNLVLSQEVSSSFELAETELNLTFAESFHTLFSLLQNNSATKQNAKSIISLMGHKAIEKSKDFDMLPISVVGASQDSIILNVPTYWAVSKTATKEEQTIAKSFLSWIYTSETGNALLIDALDWLSPFENTTQTPKTPVKKTVLKYAANGKTMPYVLNGLNQEIYNKIVTKLSA